MFGANKYSNIMGIKDPGKNLGGAAQAVGLVSGVSDLFGGGDEGGGGATQPGQASVADPFAGQREQYWTDLRNQVTASGQPGAYQNQLATLMSSPGSMATSPMYQFAFDQGLNAVNRTQAARGMLGSGNRLYELTNYGQGLAGQQYFNQANLLSGLQSQEQNFALNRGNQLAMLSGAGVGNPYGAAQLGAANQQAGWTSVAQGLGGLANSTSGLFDNTGSYAGGTADMTGFYTPTPDYFAPVQSSFGADFTI